MDDMLLQSLCIISQPSVSSNWSYSPELPNLGKNRRFCLTVWARHLTDYPENNKAPLLCNIKLCASFYHYMCIQPGVTVRKGLNWILTSVTLTLTLAFYRDITSVIGNGFMMIRWWEHNDNSVTDIQADRRTNWTIHGAAWSQLKMSVDQKCTALCVISSKCQWVSTGPAMAPITNDAESHCCSVVKCDFELFDAAPFGMR